MTSHSSRLLMKLLSPRQIPPSRKNILHMTYRLRHRVTDSALNPVSSRGPCSLCVCVQMDTCHSYLVKSFNGMVCSIATIRLQNSNITSTVSSGDAAFPHSRERSSSQGPPKPLAQSRR